jgi:hypothetical protein
MRRSFLATLLVFVLAFLLEHQIAAQSRGNSQSTPKPSEQETEMRDDPNGRNAWFLRGRIISEVGLAANFSPADKLMQSLQQLSKLTSSRPSPRTGLAAAGPVNWTELGPRPEIGSWGPVSGRVTSLAVDLVHDPTGNTVYVGTAFGGLWKTTNAQSTDPQKPPHFIPLGDPSHWYSLSVGSVALDTSSDPPKIYVGTGEANNSLDSYYGVGILKSEDGGASWTGPVTSAVNGGTTFSFVGGSVAKILVDPAKPTVVIAAIGSASNAVGKQPDVGIYESHDGGNSWTQTLNLSENQQLHDCTDLIYEPTEGTYYAALRGLGIYRYKIGGQWVPLSAPFPGAQLTVDNFNRISLATRTTNNVVTIWALVSDHDGALWPATSAAGTGLAESVDGGSHWRAVGVPDELFGDKKSGYQGWYDQYLLPLPDGKSLALGGIDLWVAHSINGMQTKWINLTNAYSNTRTAHPDQHSIVAIDSGKWIIGNDGGVWRTLDAGDNWTSLNTDLNTIQFMSVAPDPANATQIFGGSQDNGTALTSGGALTWNLVLDGDGGYALINPSIPSQYFAEQFHISLYRSDNSGRNWSQVVGETKINEREGFYIPYQLLPGNPYRVVLGTYRVWRGPAKPTFSGDGWNPISNDLTAGGKYDYIQALSVAPSAPSTVYAVTTDSRVWVTGNASGSNPIQSWRDVTHQPLPKERPFAAITVSPNNPKLVYLGVQGFDSGHLYKSTTAGVSWLDISGNLPNTPVNDILIDPQIPADIYVATDIGVFVTSDGGTPQSNWTLYDGEHLPRSAVLQIKLSSMREIVAATHGRGAWHINTLHNPEPPVRKKPSRARQSANKPN